MGNIRFLDDSGAFLLNEPEGISGLYFPLAGEKGLKSAVAPNLGGDCKLDQEGFLLEPVSVENLHTSRSTRNFWCVTDQGCWSASGVSARQETERFTQVQDKSVLTAGLMWHSAGRTSAFFGLRSEIISFVPPSENVEVMAVKLTNTSASPQTVTAIAAVPIYGRSADNIRDHRNVTSMLHRIRTTAHGVLVKPTMSFDEKGHRENHRIYYALGAAGDGAAPQSFYPTVESFIGEGGSFLKPRAVYEADPGVPAGTCVDGREAMGGIRFPAVTLKPGETVRYTVLLGISEDEDEIERLRAALSTPEQVEAALEHTKEYWQDRVNVRYHTGDDRFDRLMRWVSFQPFLRRIYGCSFLPHHDYGRGGRGWRDLWQDCLSLLPLILPSVASPAVFYFMHSYMQSSLPKELIEAARIDGSHEFGTFNRIVLPIMKPAIAVQAIFTFVGSWNNYFVPALVITSKNKQTLPIMIATLRGADYMNFDMGKIYMMITIAIMPIIIIYLLLSKFIVEGVTLGGVKE